MSWEAGSFETLGQTELEEGWNGTSLVASGQIRSPPRAAVQVMGTDVRGTVFTTRVKNQAPRKPWDLAPWWGGKSQSAGVDVVSTSLYIKALGAQRLIYFG